MAMGYRTMRFSIIIGYRKITFSSSNAKLSIFTKDTSTCTWSTIDHSTLICYKEFFVQNFLNLGLFFYLTLFVRPILS